MAGKRIAARDLQITDEKRCVGYACKDRKPVDEKRCVGYGCKDRKPVDGWDLLLKPGTQEFTLVAPTEAGEYVAICTVICGPDHEQMDMKVRVEP